MNIRIYFSLFCLLLSFSSFAQDKNDSEPLIRIIEMERLIVNWSPNDSGLGRVLAYTCQDCPATNMIIDPGAELEINGQLRPMSELATKVDWAGAITVTDQAPNNILKFSMY
ncbi:hypothetical protein [Pseudomonas sp. TMP9]|uniref:hypothetical protein n=1 Tax=Pseudomonas sp. TMP9 TaxID=3133144 RepID=UPI0030CEAE64